MSRISIRFLYSEECPSHNEALHRLRTVLEEEGIHANIEVVQVETQRDALKWHYLGSPTILVNGVDIALTADPHQQYAIACRAYVLEDGRISPLPSTDMIRKAVRSASEGHA